MTEAEAALVRRAEANGIRLCEACDGKTEGGCLCGACRGRMGLVPAISAEVRS